MDSRKINEEYTMIAEALVKVDYIRHHDLDDFQLIIRQYGVDWSHSN